MNGSCASKFCVQNLCVNASDISGLLVLLQYSWFDFQQVLDHETYIVNLAEANLSPHKAPTWALEYSAKVSGNTSQLVMNGCMSVRETGLG